MNSILYKYRNENDEYLIYDLKKNCDRVDAGKARFFFSQNFGLAAKGILAGPVVSDGKISMKLFTPDGGEAIAWGASEQFSRKFLKDAGYLNASAGTGSDISFAGKVFVFD